MPGLELVAWNKLAYIGTRKCHVVTQPLGWFHFWPFEFRLTVLLWSSLHLDPRILQSNLTSSYFFNFAVCRVESMPNRRPPCWVFNFTTPRLGCGQVTATLGQSHSSGAKMVRLHGGRGAAPGSQVLGEGHPVYCAKMETTQCPGGD
jgi:hypothetical protein